METVPCNLCGSNDSVSVLTGQDRFFKSGNSFRIVRCRNCRLAYLNPRPSSMELTAHYPFEYYNGWMRDYSQCCLTGVMKAGADMIRRRRMPRGTLRGRALEIGIGGAQYLIALRDAGWEVQGVEISPELAQSARDRFGLNVRTGSAETALPEFPDNYFDVVAMWHVLEHLTDPHGVLKQVRRILTPGARLMMELPNFAGLSRMIFRTHWAALDLPRHLYHFTPETLEAMLTRAGLRVTRIRGVPAALVATMSLQLLWNELRGVLNSNLVANPALLALFFPGSTLLAKANLSAHMSAEAVKP